MADEEDNPVVLEPWNRLSADRTGRTDETVQRPAVTRETGIVRTLPQRLAVWLEWVPTDGTVVSGTNRRKRREGSQHGTIRTCGVNGTTTREATVDENGRNERYGQRNCLRGWWFGSKGCPQTERW